MKPEVKTLLCEKLRSGEYKQGQEYLNKDGKLCFLGVVCDLSGVGKWIDWLSVPGVKSYVTRSQGDTMEIPIEARRWAGFTDKDQDDLIYLNDVKGLSFSELADYLEKNY